MTRMDRMSEAVLHAERAVLGACMLDESVIALLEGSLDAEDFHRAAHGRLWSLVMELHAKQQPADMVTLATEAAQRGEDYGGAAYITSLPESVVSTQNVEHYAEKIRTHAMRRRLLEAASELRQAAEEERSPVDALATAERRLQVLAGSSVPQDFVSARDIMEEQWKAYGERAQRKIQGACSGLSTGYPDLDRITGGLRAPDLIILAARPAVGKTALGLNIARNIAKGGIGVAFCSQEMSRGQCLDRMVAAEMCLSAEGMRDGFHRDDHKAWDALADGVEIANRWPLWVTDSAGMKVSALASRVRRLKAAQPHLGLLVVDYLQIMGVEDSKANRETQVAQIATGLKRIAMSSGIPVIAIAQLNRSVEARANKRPNMSDLRESGQIEQDADIIAFLYRDDYYNPESQDAGIAEVNIEKNRNGRTGQARLSWKPVWQRFDGVEFGG